MYISNYNFLILIFIATLSLSIYRKDKLQGRHNLLLGYFTIKNELEISYTLNRIREQMCSSIFVSDPPDSAGHDKKVLKIYKNSNIYDFVKLEGPSTIIDKIYSQYKGKKSI